MTTMTDPSAALRWAEGYADAAGWLPTADAEELLQLAELRDGSRVIFIWRRQSLAAYLGSGREGDGADHDHPIGDIDPWCPYGRGFFAALADRRPDMPGQRAGQGVNVTRALWISQEAGTKGRRGPGGDLHKAPGWHAWCRPCAHTQGARAVP
jgi:hypothetical protein